MEAQDVAARDQKSPLLGKQRHLISRKGIGHHLPQGWISPHMGQKPQQLTMGHRQFSNTCNIGLPGTPTVVRAPPLRATGMLNEAPRLPTEIELNPPL